MNKLHNTVLLHKFQKCKVDHKQKGIGYKYENTLNKVLCLNVVLVR